jgi:D-serine deaminase-like pyridoxal phosphate-dependent protein
MRFEDLQTPALLVDMTQVRANVARMAEILAARGGLARWRPHVKTAKIAAVQSLLLDAGVRKFKAATTREARVLLELAEAAGIEVDLLVAMSHRGANLARVAELARDFTAHRVSLLTEDVEHAREVRASDAKLGLFVDIDPRWGRSGIPLDDRARIRATVDACGDALRGVHFYEGQERSATHALRAAACAPLFDGLCALVRELDLGQLEVITSGTPTFEAALEHRGLNALRHTVSPGIVVYFDGNSLAFGIAGFRPAVHVLARVISAPSPQRITVDAGSKALDAAAGDPCAQVEDWPGLVAAHANEEHLPFVVREGAAPRPGTLLRLLPRHVCPAVNLADVAVLVEHGAITSIVPVDARGHETAR